jgi:hypothetical protein
MSLAVRGGSPAIWRPWARLAWAGRRAYLNLEDAAARPKKSKKVLDPEAFL